MAQLGKRIDTSNVPEDSGRIPAGTYECLITEAVIKGGTKNGYEYSYLEVTFEISAPTEYSGRRMWERFTLVNASSDAVRIGEEQLARLGKACYIPVVEDTDQIVGRGVMVTVKYRTRNGEDERRLSYSQDPSQAPVAVPAPQAPAPQPQPQYQQPGRGYTPQPQAVGSFNFNGYRNQ